MKIVIPLATAERLRKHCIFGTTMEGMRVFANTAEIEISEESLRRLERCRLLGETITEVIDRLLDFVEGVKPS